MLNFVRIWIWLLAPAVCLAQVTAQHDEILTHFRAAIMATEQVHDPAAALSILEEAHKQLRLGCENKCQELLNSVYDSVVRERSDENGVFNERKRGELFRRFLHVVAQLDPALVAHYIELYRHDRPEIKPATWDTANDLFEDDLAGSMRIASLAASTSTYFPDAALIYLQRLAGQSPQDAAALTRKAINNVPEFSADSRLELLAYLFSDGRVPELIDSSIGDREIPDRPAVSAAPRNTSLVNAFVRNVTASPLPDAQADMLVLVLTEKHLSETALTQVASVRRAEQRDAQALPPEAVSRIQADVSKWMAGGDTVQQSAQDAENKFQTSKDGKFRNRATLLQAISLSRQGKFEEALSLLSALPGESRDSARDAVLLFAADAVNSPDQAVALASRSRVETRSEFVIGYAELASVRLAVRKSPDDQRDVSATLDTIEHLADQLSGTKRLTLHLATAIAWSDLNRERALTALDSSLKDLDEGKSLDGSPRVVLVLSVPGMSVEYSIARVNLYQVVRRLATLDIESTLAHLNNANREDIRLRSIVAASAEYLTKAVPEETSTQ